MSEVSDTLRAARHPRCASCTFWEREGLGNFGKCRFNPPQATTYQDRRGVYDEEWFANACFDWPDTLSDAWCGQHRAIEMEEADG